MRNYLRMTIPLLIVVGFVWLFARGLGKDPREVPSALIGKPAPAFVLPSLIDEQKTFGSIMLNNQVYLLNVWASWCAACKEEHPYLMELSQKNIVPIYGMNYKDDRLDAVNLIKNKGNPYREIVYDGNGLIGVDYGVSAVPETFLVDKNGIVLYKHSGALTPEIFETKIKPLIQK